MSGSACSIPPRVSSENTTPNPNVSSAAFRSHTVISWPESSCLASAEKYSPPGPPPTTAIRTQSSFQAYPYSGLTWGNGNTSRMCLGKSLRLGYRVTMATRAPKGASRPTAGAAGRSRPSGGSSRPRTSSGTSRTSASRSSAARRGSKPYYRSRSGYGRSRPSAASAMRASHNPFVILIGWIVAAIAAIWMELAGGVGFVARLFGDSARELDPAHRRDGAGLAVLAATIVVAWTAWWHLGSPLGRALSAFVRGTFGVGAWVIPVLLGLLAFRLLRHPDRNAHTGRMVVGWSALLIGALGIVHIALGSPQPKDGAAAMRSSGGLIGFVISAPLKGLLTTWAAIPVLALLAAFGVLVITGTPLHRIPERFTELRYLLSGRVPEELEEGAIAEAG